MTDNGNGNEPLPTISERPTRPLDPTEIKPSWPVVVAYLDQLSEWGVAALRLGILELIEISKLRLARLSGVSGDADTYSISLMRELVEVLAHIPREPRARPAPTPPPPALSSVPPAPHYPASHYEVDVDCDVCRGPCRGH